MNLCSDCSPTAEVQNPDGVTHCENCGLALQPEARLHSAPFSPAYIREPYVDRRQLGEHSELL